MREIRCHFVRSGLFLSCLFALSVSATTFTNNAVIGHANTNYDGADVVVSNCTLTVDGPHTFNNVWVTPGGTLTYTYASNGAQTNQLSVTNEPQTLNGTNAAQLNDPNIVPGTVSVADSTGTNFYASGQDYLLTTNGVETLLARATNSSIPDGATVLVSYNALQPIPSGLYLTVVGSLEVDAGGTINANAGGYGAGAGSGTGMGGLGNPADGSGGGYGGYGGPSSSNALGGNCYGSYVAPTNLGSGGGFSYAGPGGAGGGLIQIAVGSNVLINGLVTANGGNGTNSRSGGGSGGSIFITGAAFSGTGIVTANGGSGQAPHGGGGGGGRISFQYTSDNFTGIMSACGGAGSTAGGAGTIYTQPAGQPALLLVDNGGQAGTNTVLSINSFTGIDLVVQSNAQVVQSNVWQADSITVASNASIILASVSPVPINVASLVVEQGGIISADGEGSPAGSGSGAGHIYNDGFYRPCGGGGYGGNGAYASIPSATGGVAYGFQVQPFTSGSGGGSQAPYSTGGAGGGSIQIQADTLVVEGTISANGLKGTGSGGGGGSGGSIYINAQTLAGSGFITANGGSGAGNIGGGGGGGRLEITAAMNLFEGDAVAFGGGGGGWGGAGTVYWNNSPGKSQLIIDNGGNPGTNTPVQTLSGDLIVQGGAIASSSVTVTFQDLYIYSNGWLNPSYGSLLPASSVYFQVNGNATIDAGGGIIADFAGGPAGAGGGPGRAVTLGSTNFGSGASHGGIGGNSYGNYAAASGVYDSPVQPTLFGSGGGGISASSSIGGTGGGGVNLIVTGVLEDDGVISANGGNGLGLAGGGGSGGSILITAATLSGAGRISANGGSGASGLGGGGGGGMIYVSVNNNSFTGSMSAYGGPGANYGGAGTVATQVAGKNALLIMDANGASGAATPLPNSSSIDVTMRNGAIGLVTSSESSGNVTVSSNAWLLVSNGLSAAMTFSSLTVQPGGGIIADSNGIGPAAGGFSGTSPYYACGGGGNVGPGGYSFGNLARGGIANNVNQSLYAGGPGGGAAPYSTGGLGGGGILITVSGLLQLDGLISANGGNGGGIGGGGGAGGTIRLTANTLAGTGVIRANGGSGAGSIGGGGGGGFIVLDPTVNQFNGTVTAYGGGGFTWGGCGASFLETNGGTGTFMLDAGNNPGVPTPVQAAYNENLLLRNGASGVTTGGPWGSVFLASNTSLELSNTSYETLFSVSSLTVQAGALLNADSLSTIGSGNGNSYSGSPSYPCSGGGHGGYGGNSLSNLAAGGHSYDSPTIPSQVGSPGGSYSPDSFGGNGGGAFSISSSGLIQIDGIVSANGGNGTGNGGGGGSGGTITIVGGTLGGSGTIRANGGNGVASVGGGGGGGCILINPALNQFIGAITAYGGTGANPGGAGTIYTELNGQGGQIIIDSGGVAGSVTPLPTISSLGLSLRNGAVGLVSSSGLSFGNATIGSNSWILVSNTSSSSTISFSSLTIQPGGGITADSLGFPAGVGTGAGHSYGVPPYYPCGGAGHGGLGGAGSSNQATGGSAFDTQSSPFLPGSGGGNDFPYSTGGSGGGAFAINVTGVLQNDGMITANGASGSGVGGGGGSGGAIKIGGGTLSGAGTIRANGGNGAGNIGGGGAGGCIMVTSANLFSGTISAYGGGGANAGGAGTVFLESTSAPYQLIVDNNGRTSGSTPIQSVSTQAGVVLRNGAMGYVSSPTEFFASFLVSSNSWLTANPTLSLGNTGNIAGLTISGNLTVQAGGGIVVDSYGYAEGTGNGSGQVYSGAGYGGSGGNGQGVTAGAPYGSIVAPTALGSGGGYSLPYSIGGAGGGAIRLTVNGTLDDSGIISANGGNGFGLSGGGGSGGSIYLTLQTLTGSGTISANGGAGVQGNGGGGSGGRISISCTLDSFTGSITAAGGSGNNYGAAGTIYTAQGSATGQVLVDNGGSFGTNTPISAAFGLPASPFNLTIQNGGIVGSQTQTNFPELANLTVGSNGVLTEFGKQTPLDLTVLNNAVIGQGGAIDLDGDGNIRSSGPGYGILDYVGSGAGYGGIGGASAETPGGQTYGSATMPLDLGSGGGSGTSIFTGWSSGGGAVRLTVGGALVVEGEISAGGNPGVDFDYGGGSGGSILINAGILAGTGSITANGGDGSLPDGGGGGGGRIALYSITNLFFGQKLAAGGVGYDDGGNGSVVSSNTIPSLTVVSMSPGGIVNTNVSAITLVFNLPPNPASVNTATVTLTTPSGDLPSSSNSIAEINPETYVLTVPAQTAAGLYTVSVGAGVEDYFNRSVSPAYSGTFTIAAPVIQGAIIDTNGNPVAGVLVQASGGLGSATTDTNGNYSLAVPGNSSFTITPSLGGEAFVPGARSYTNVFTAITGQNYTALPMLAPTLTAIAYGSTIELDWQAVNGVSYQVYTSMDLVAWVPYEGSFANVSGPMHVTATITNNTGQYFTIGAH
jgi:hypothetical protein